MGSVPKFKAGDPVWVRSVDEARPKGEYAGTVTLVTDVPCPLHEARIYGVEVPSVPISGYEGWAVCEPFLRPRRDDYQQREPLGSRQDLDKPLISIYADELPDHVREKLEEIAE